MTGRRRTAEELAARAAADDEEFRTLPAPVDARELVVSVPLREQPDPGIEPDPDRAFLLRYAP